MSDANFIRQSMILAARAVQNGNHPFGALLVLDLKVLLSAENTVITENDWTRHAELNLIRAAKREYDAKLLAGGTLYASTEPCAMCAGAICKVGIRRVVFGCSAATLENITGGGGGILARRVFAAAEKPIEVVGPILEEQAAAIHRSFWRSKSGSR